MRLAGSNLSIILASHLRRAERMGGCLAPSAQLANAKLKAHFLVPGKLVVMDLTRPATLARKQLVSNALWSKSVWTAARVLSNMLCFYSS